MIVTLVTKVIKSQLVEPLPLGFFFPFYLLIFKLKPWLLFPAKGK